MELHLDLIDSKEQLTKVCHKLSQTDCIAFDTEFIREKTFFPQLALIQLATDEEAWLLDVLAFEKEQLGPLLEIFESPKILKIIHSAFGDQECLYSAYGITAKNTLDTFECASLLGYGESVSLRDLIIRSFNIKIPKYLTRTNWLKRPMNEEMRRYAMTDVEYLVPLGKMLLKSLGDLGRKEWAFTLSQRYEEENMYISHPEEMAKKIAKSGRVNSKNFLVFQDLIIWRESRARHVDIPRKRISDDATLINIANSRPKSIDHLKKFRGINLHEVKKHGDKLMKIIHGTRENVSGSKLSPPRIVKPSSDQSRIIDFLSTYLKSLCQDYQIASRLILTVKELQKIVTENLMDPQEWVRLKICSPEAAKLMGQDLIAVMEGKKGLGIQNGKLTQLDL